MNKKSVVFYEVNEESTTFPRRLPKLGIIDSEVFDYINTQGAATPKAILEELNYQSQSVLNSALASLQSSGLITRRNVTMEYDE